MEKFKNTLFRKTMKTRAGNTLRQFALLAFLGLVPACGSNPNTNLVTSGNPYGVAPASSPSNPNTVNGFNQNQDIMPLLPGIPMWGPGMLPMAEDPCCCCDPCANARSRRNRRTRPAHSSSSGTSSSSSSSSSGSSNDDQDGSNRSRDDSDRTLPAQIVMRYQDDGKNQIDYHLQIGADGKTIQIRLNSIDGKTQPLTIPLSPTDDPALNQSVQNGLHPEAPDANPG
ncbi:MAG: hypothetical protein EBX52_05465 [Proteobacteria bacterium]|nr:hypothetical protein [Pseudomonadota bacterium]